MSRRRVAARLATVLIGVMLPGITLAFAAPATTSSPQARLAALSSPPKKYYGMFLSRSPNRLDQVHQVTAETGKQPNLSLFFESWNSVSKYGGVDFSLTGAAQACQAGMLPMMTWQSWDTRDFAANGAPNPYQPEYSPRRIIGGAFDPYIRRVAQMVAQLDCPIAIRFDHEDNSSWYPWGLAAPGMHNTPALYIAMWRHVWRIFQAENAHNVLWVWSPNVQYHRHPGLPGLARSYPGRRYVNWVGIDGYFIGKRGSSFDSLFGHTLRRLRHIAPRKPWLIGETGVASGPDKPQLIQQLYAGVARNQRLIGVNYFDLNKPGARSNWAFDETPASTAAFRKAVNSPAYGAGVPGQSPGS